MKAFLNENNLTTIRKNYKDYLKAGIIQELYNTVAKNNLFKVKEQ